MECKFFGVCGAYPNNTSTAFNSKTACVTIETDDAIIIFDAGSGLIDCGYSLINSTKPIFLCFSHFHHDHLIGLPHFYPLFNTSTTVNFVFPNKDKLKDVFNTMFSPTFFPLGINDFSCNYSFLTPKECEAFNIFLDTFTLNHPGGSIAYKLTTDQHCIVYATDHEAIDNHDDFYTFNQNSSLYIADSWLFDEPAHLYKGWGHSSISDVLEIAEKSAVKHLALFHHMPTRSVGYFEQLETFITNYLKEKNNPFFCSIAKEGSSLAL